MRAQTERASEHGPGARSRRGSARVKGVNTRPSSPVGSRSRVPGPGVVTSDGRGHLRGSGRRPPQHRGRRPGTLERRPLYGQGWGRHADRGFSASSPAPVLASKRIAAQRFPSTRAEGPSPVPAHPRDAPTARTRFADCPMGRESLDYPRGDASVQSRKKVTSDGDPALRFTFRTSRRGRGRGLLRVGESGAEGG
jgi:hypothetical protein